MKINSNISSFLKGYSFDVDKINRLIVSAFCDLNLVIVNNNKIISDLIIFEKDTEEFKALQIFKSIFRKYNQEFTFEHLIELFEFVISPKDKIYNGAVYTPNNIRNFIVNDSTKNNPDVIDALVCDIACGCGGFLFEFTKLVYSKGKPIKDIIEENIFGVDITEYSIERTKILLCLFALVNNEDVESYKFNLFVGDSLEFDWFKESLRVKSNGGFSYIFGNPPYVGSLNLDDKTKYLIKKWKVSSIGKLDLYIPFFEIGMHWLKDAGKLGYITVNNFYRSLNGRALRNYFSENKFHFKFIDFGDEQIFIDRITYTCICQITKSIGDINYTSTKSKNIKQLIKSDFAIIKYEDLNNKKGWLLDKFNVQINIKRLENSGSKISELFKIRNGLATLRNKIYIFDPVKKDDIYYYFKRGNKIFRIEREICRDAIKPNIIKTEADILTLKKQIIFPYELINNKIKILNEESLKNNFPFTYKYLLSQKNELAKRDKGNKKYETWYAFGRNQALNIKGKKLLFPYISDKPYFVFTNDEDLLFYNGYAIISKSSEDLKFIRKILTSDVFWYYIKNCSKPYSGNYFALAKNYIKDFTIPKFSKKERKHFISLKQNSAINKVLLKKYNISKF